MNKPTLVHRSTGVSEHPRFRSIVACLTTAFAVTCTSLTSAAAEESSNIGGGNFPVNETVSTHQVIGTVLDENGDPLAGVTAAVKGTKLLTVTDLNGNFTLKVTDKQVIELTYVGFKTASVQPGAAATVTVSMTPDSEVLDDVVVIGYGTMKKRDLTGSIASVKAEDIVKTPTGNVIEAIQGQVAGLDITRSSGEAGASVNMNLRGVRSINGDNNPLFIIDGMEGSYEELNPNDIASIEVLKGASSTAIYGAAGANGVIIITTKNPDKGRHKVDFNAYYGWNKITKFPEVNMGDAYVNFRREALRTTGAWESAADDSKLFPSYMQDFIDKGQWVNWSDMASRTGSVQSYDLSTSYSNDKITSYFSLGYYGLEGLLKGDELKRYSARAKIDYNASKYLTYGLNLYAMYSDNDKRYSRIWNRVMNMPPMGQIFDENGGYVDYPLGDGNMNPLADNADGQYLNNVKTLSVTPQIYAEIRPLAGLTFRTVLGGYFRNAKQGIYNGNHSYQGLESGKVLASIPNTFDYNYKWQNILTYDFAIKDAHRFTVTGVAEWSKNTSETSEATANVFDSDAYGYYNLGAATGTPTVSSSYVKNQMMSYAARVNYSYLGRYLATVTARWDGASILADGNKWDVFPAAALGWRVSDEPFMEWADALSNFKIRGEYGVTGNAGAAEYATMAYSRTGVVGFQDVSVPYSGFSSNIANLDLAWEKSYNLDLGFDMGFFNERLSLVFDWYRTRTKDLLFEQNLPYGMGGYGGSPFKMWANVGETRNTGVELAVTSRNITNKDFTWTTTVTFSTNKNEVVKTTSEGPLVFGDYYLIPGEGVHTYYGYKYAGIWGTAEADEAAKYAQKPGQVHIAENGEPDGKLNADDYYVLGNGDPRWSASMVNNFTYKDFDLSFMLIARWDWTIPYGLTGWYRTDGLSPSPAICDYWTPENQSARYPRPDASISNGQDPYQNWANYFDGSYLKVRNITFGYTLPRNLLKKLSVERARLYFTASNPFIWTKNHYLKDYDPEKGGDDDAAPLSKQFVFGVNLTF